MEINLSSTVRQYLSLKDEIALLSKRQTELKERLSSVVESNGEENDRGHITLTVVDSIKGEIKLTRQKRVSKTLDLNVAEEILIKNGIKNECIKMIPTLDEAAIMSAFYEEKLTEADIDAMFPAKVSYAFLVDIQDSD